MKQIITLTLSPAMDIEYHTDAIDDSGFYRTQSHTVSAGGKGINVSRAIASCLRRRIMLPEPVQLKTVAPLGGPMGALLADICAKEDLPVTAVAIEGNTRTNVSLIGNDGEIEINAPGTPIGDKRDAIEAAILDDLNAGDVVVIAGSCPADVEKSYPAALVKKIKEKGAVAVLDCDGEALKIAVNSDCPPDIIKPNRAELEALVGEALPTMRDVCRAAEALPVPIVITTLAGDGSILTREVNDYRASSFVPTVKKKVVRLKGAGDTFLGAYLYYRFAMQELDLVAMAFAADFAACYVSGE